MTLRAPALATFADLLALGDWLVAPAERLLEAFRRQGAARLRLGAWGDTERARIAPFDAVELDLARLFPPAG